MSSFFLDVLNKLYIYAVWHKLITQDHDLRINDPVTVTKDGWKCDQSVQDKQDASFIVFNFDYFCPCYCRRHKTISEEYKTMY